MVDRGAKRRRLDAAPVGVGASGRGGGTGGGGEFFSSLPPVRRSRWCLGLAKWCSAGGERRRMGRGKADCPASRAASKLSPPSSTPGRPCAPPASRGHTSELLSGAKQGRMDEGHGPMNGGECFSGGVSQAAHTATRFGVRTRYRGVRSRGGTVGLVVGVRSGRSSSFYNRRRKIVFTPATAPSKHSEAPLA
jgi:hypothetical protein